MKFEKKLAQMDVDEIVQEIGKHVRVMSWKEEVEFFEKSHRQPQGKTVLDWGICKKCLCKCKTPDDVKELNIKAWVNLFKWTPMLDREAFLKYMIENFFEDEETLCTQKAWGKIKEVIEDAFRRISKENK